MRLRAWLALVAVGLAMLSPGGRAFAAVAAGAALPHAPAPGVTYSIWTINGATIHLRFILPVAEARALDPTGKSRPDAAAASVAVAAGVSVASAGGDCPQMVQSEWVGKIYTLVLTPGLYRYEIIFECPSAAGLVLHNTVLMDSGAKHLNYARVQVDGAKPVLQTFTGDRQYLTLPPGGGAAKGAGLVRFARLGIEGFLNQADRWLVIAALALLARSRRELIGIGAALGVGYLGSLAMALNGGLTTDAGLSGAVLGLLAAILGVRVMRREVAGAPSGRGWRIGATVGAAVIVAAILAAAALKGVSAALTTGGMVVFGLAQMGAPDSAPRTRWLVLASAALLGLLDGLGPARDLAILQFKSLQLATVFVGYDLGAFVTAAALVAVAMAMLWLIGRRVRPGGKVALDLAAAALVGMGLFGFVSRLYS